jgi:DNA-binding HxlR family transcriptional regulator
MECTTTETGTVCPVSRTMSILGDPWTVLILRELFQGAVHFEEILVQTDVPPAVLAERLEALENEDMLVSSTGERFPVRREYRLTQKGLDFFPVLYALRAWGETWFKPDGSEYAVRFTHRLCGKDVGLESFCAHCKSFVGKADLVRQPSRQWEEERANRRNKFRKQAS